MVHMYCSHYSDAECSELDPICPGEHVLSHIDANANIGKGIHALYMYMTAKSYA